MSSNTTATTTSSVDSDFVIYYPLILIIVGTIFNLLTLLVLCREPFRDVKKHPSMHYLRAIAIFDIFMLYGWNFDHYLSPTHGFTMLNLSIPTCKFFSFINYFAAQTSAWLRVFVSLDRYILLSRQNRTMINKSKGILFITASIILVTTILNLPLPILACYYRTNGKISYTSEIIRIYPLWDYINLGVYNITPFLLMSLFNSGVIHNLVYHHRTTTVQQSRVPHRPIAITLVITTFMFSCMTIPVTVAYAFFYDAAGSTLLHALDSMLYTYHILSFPLYMITFNDYMFTSKSSNSANFRTKDRYCWQKHNQTKHSSDKYDCLVCAGIKKNVLTVQNQSVTCLVVVLCLYFNVLDNYLSHYQNHAAFMSIDLKLICTQTKKKIRDNPRE